MCVCVRGSHTRGAPGLCLPARRQLVCRPPQSSRWDRPLPPRIATSLPVMTHPNLHSPFAGGFAFAHGAREAGRARAWRGGPIDAPRGFGAGKVAVGWECVGGVVRWGGNAPRGGGIGVSGAGGGARAGVAKFGQVPTPASAIDPRFLPPARPLTHSSGAALPQCDVCIRHSTRCAGEHARTVAPGRRIRWAPRAPHVVPTRVFPPLRAPCEIAFRQPASPASVAKSRELGRAPTPAGGRHPATMVAGAAVSGAHGL